MIVRWIPLAAAVFLIPACDKKAPPATGAWSGKEAVSTESRSLSAPADVEANDGEGPSGPTRAVRPKDRVYPKPPKLSYPVAKPIDGKPGMVMSPYSEAIIDVTGLASGSLARDPSAPDAEKSLFRVP